MANNYTSFSTTINLPGVTPEEVDAWIEERLPQYDDSDYGASGFQAQYEDGALWVWDDDGFTDNVVEFIQETLAKFEIVGTVVFEYAYTCSKPRPGEFGGGVVLITKDNSWWSSPDDFIETIRCKHSLPPVIN
jgi:hypothetical protein